jgi:hypothetical protein
MTMSEEAMGELTMAFREQPNQEKSAVIFIHPDVQKRIKLATDVSFFGLVTYGWRLFYLSFEDWRDVVSSATPPDEFFYHLGYRD